MVVTVPVKNKEFISEKFMTLLTWAVWVSVNMGCALGSRGE